MARAVKELKMLENEKKVSKVVIRRLPRYYRYLSDLKNNGVIRISSMELSEKMNVTASQIRQDLNCFGGFGQQGYGYNVEQLHAAIGDILGLNKHYKTIIIGAGNLGHALANYAGFEKRGFKLVGIFDINPDVIGTVINNIEVKDFSTIEAEAEILSPDIAILAIPKTGANETASLLAKLGIRGIWNFSYMELKVPDNVCVENVHLSDSLMTLSHNITKLNRDQEEL